MTMAMMRMVGVSIVQIMLIVITMTRMAEMKMGIMKTMIVALMKMVMAIKYDDGNGDDDVGYYDLKYNDHAIKITSMYDYGNGDNDAGYNEHTENDGNHIDCA